MGEAAGPDVSVPALLRLLVLAMLLLLWAVLWLAVERAVGVTAALVQPIRDVFEGALDGGHQRLNGLQLLRGRVDGGVLRHDVAVIVTEGTERPLQRKEGSMSLECLAPSPHKDGGMAEEEGEDRRSKKKEQPSKNSRK